MFRAQRAGIAFYFHYIDDTYYVFGVDDYDKWIDFGGGAEADEFASETAVREYSEEAHDCFGTLIPEDLTDDVCLYEKDSTLFLHLITIPRSSRKKEPPFEEYRDIFHRLNDVSSQPELKDIIYVTREELLYELVSPKSNFYSVTGTVLRRHKDLL